MINYDLKKIKAIVFDVDGVLSQATIGMDADGQPVRTMNVKDGYAIRSAIKNGLRIAIMTGGDSEVIEKRYRYLGVEDIYMHCFMKTDDYNDFLQRYALHSEEVLYMGDDIPDYEVMKTCGCPCCPADACPEIKSISLYISQVHGGEGCARDIIEQVMRAQGTWMSDQAAFGWQ